MCQMCQKVSNVVFHPIFPTDKGLIGFASLLYNGSLALNSIAVYTRPSGDGIRCVFPETRLVNGKVINTFFPINQEANVAITDAIEQKIKEVTAKIDNASEEGLKDVRFEGKN